jgi:formylglycine-generating enzyme required for sulfatase activity
MESDRPQITMTEIVAKPERTYALVVGIEKYHETAWNVKGGGPVNDALKFAEWLCKRGVPKENIRLCLSPLEENCYLVEQSELEVEAATENNVSDIIENVLSKKKGDLLFIFWEGHGLLTSERERRLLCADATYKNWQNLNLDSLLLLLRSNLFEIQNHICIVDACANYLLESNRRPTNLKGKEFSSGQPMLNHKQFVLLATREGEKAIVNTKSQTGYFSQAVREALEQEILETWPPNMKAIAEKVKQQVTSLNNNKQLPIYFEICSWDGDRGIYSLKDLNLPEKIPQLNDESVKNISAKSPILLIPDTTTFDFEVVTVNAQGRETKRCSQQGKYFIESLSARICLEMVYIPDGKFSMGAPKEEFESDEDERPQNLVSIKSFFMSRYPITQAQWRVVAEFPKIQRELDLDLSYFKGDNLPVERVRWRDAQEFCARLSQQTGRIYRLPSEAEWEYACRARTTTPFHFGATITTDLANYCGEDPNQTYKQQTTEVGIFPVNTFGLCDMHGLVWEWCEDYQHEDYQGAPLDGSAWVNDGNSEYRILRGGSWNSSARFCRSASRFFENPNVRDKEFGFRVVCSFG